MCYLRGTCFTPAESCPLHVTVITEKCGCDHTPYLLWKVEHAVTSGWSMCEWWGRGMMNIFSCETTKHLDI